MKHVMTPKEIRREIIELSVTTKISHIASALSCVEILCALRDMDVFEKTSIDRFILSKGHGCLGLYIILQEAGYNPKLIHHPDIDINNGIECTTGSLGHGLPIGVGMALAKKLCNGGNIYVLMGDGECQEGTVWESLMIASQYELDNLCIIIDNNKLQAMDKIDNIVSLNYLFDKFVAFGCRVEMVDGHNIQQLSNVLQYMEHQKGYPKVIIADTIKGKGISFMEGNPIFHSRLLNDEELIIARKELL